MQNWDGKSCCNFLCSFKTFVTVNNNNKSTITIFFKRLSTWSSLIQLPHNYYYQNAHCESLLHSVHISKSFLLRHKQLYIGIGALVSSFQCHKFNVNIWIIISRQNKDGQGCYYSSEGRAKEPLIINTGYPSSFFPPSPTSTFARAFTIPIPFEPLLFISHCVQDFNPNPYFHSYISYKRTSAISTSLSSCLSVAVRIPPVYLSSSQCLVIYWKEDNNRRKRIPIIALCISCQSISPMHLLSNSIHNRAK